MISRVLGPDRLDEQVPEARPDDFLGDDVIVSKLDVTLGFLGKGTGRNFSISSMARRLIPMRSKLKTACSATEWWPILKMIAALDRRAFSTSRQAAGQAHQPGGGRGKSGHRPPTAFQASGRGGREGSEHFVQSFPVDVITGQDDFTARPGLDGEPRRRSGRALMGCGQENLLLDIRGATERRPPKDAGQSFAALRTPAV